MQINNQYINEYKKKLGFEAEQNKSANGAFAAGSTGFYTKMSAEINKSSDSKGIATEQKQILRDKYSLDELVYSFDPDGNDKMEAFLGELKEMGIITDYEMNVCLFPSVLYERSFGGFGIPMEVREDVRTLLQMDVMGIALYEPEEAEGMNLLDACRHMAKVQEQSAQRALGNASREQFMKEAEVFNKLAGLIEEIFVM